MFSDLAYWKSLESLWLSLQVNHKGLVLFVGWLSFFFMISDMANETDFCLKSPSTFSRSCSGWWIRTWLLLLSLLYFCWLFGFEDCCSVFWQCFVLERSWSSSFCLLFSDFLPWIVSKKICLGSQLSSSHTKYPFHWSWFFMTITTTLLILACNTRVKE